MCLYIKDSQNILNKLIKQIKPLIAKEDIIVYKVLDQNNYSPYRAYKYTEGFHYYETGDIIPEVGKCSTDIIIKKGLHSYSSYTIASTRRNSTDKIVKMIIPKGSKYFIGKNEDIVSDNLIWYKGAKQYFKN